MTPRGEGRRAPDGPDSADTRSGCPGGLSAPRRSRVACVQPHTREPRDALGRTLSPVGLRSPVRPTGLVASPNTRTGLTKMEVAPKHTLMDLFAGCGGMTRGFVDTGRFEPVFAVEMDEHAAATYAANFGARARRRRQDRGRRGVPEASTSSSAGRPARASRRSTATGSGFERRALWREYLRALRESDAAGVRDGERPRTAAIGRVRRVQARGRDELGFTRRGTDPQRGRLRRPADDDVARS